MLVSSKLNLKINRKLSFIFIFADNKLSLNISVCVFDKKEKKKQQLLNESKTSMFA
jgi:hypothetical protein